jgi:hypothetical protein
MIQRRFGVAAAAAMLALTALTATPAFAATTRWVNDDATTYSPPGASCDNAGYPTINLAVAASDPGDTIRVCPGTYVEGNILNIHPLTYRGAQAGHPFPSRTFGSANESKVVGSFTINAEKTTIDGFSITNPALDNGITVKTAGDQALLTNNLIDTIGGAGLTTPTTGIYLENGPDNVRIVGNRISNVLSGTKSAQGMLVGDSTASNPSVGILITLNLVEDITSASRGAYGVQLNNGSSSAVTATGYTTAWILGNRIRDLMGGGWVHAIGLEGDTPNTRVTANTISNLVSPSQNRVAVFLEDNPSATSVHVNSNNFDVTSTSFGMFNASGAAGVVDGQCNWWDSRDGPGPVGPGHGALVGPSIDYAPWLTSPAPGGRCNGGRGHGG